MTDPWCCYIWCSMDPINIPPVMLALIYQHHGSYLILGWGFIKQLAHLGPRGPGAWLHLEGLATYHFFCTEKPNKSDH